MLSTFRDYLTSVGLSASTIADYEREIAHMETWLCHRDTELADAGPGLIAEYAGHRPNTPSIRAHLRAALSHWWDWQGLPGWASAIPVPKPAPMQCKALEADEAALLVDVARGWWRPGAAVIVGLAMGLRNQGLRELAWDGFDRDLEWYTLVEKGGRQRTVAVPPIVASELEGKRNGSAYVFEGKTGGGHVSHQTINNWIKQVGELAGFDVDDLWPHRLRHTFAAEALDNTGDLDAVAAAMGHARTDTTRGYTRTTRRRLRGVVDSLSYL